MNKVYWLHYPNHTDPTAEGYIGITNDIESRTRDHKKTFKQYFEQGAVVTVLHEVESREKAMTIEADYRPLPNIGWNTYAGVVKRTRKKPSLSTAGTMHTKMVNMRIDPKLWEAFRQHCKEQGHWSMTGRVKELIEMDLDNAVNVYQYELF